MSETFDIPVVYKGQEHLLKAELLAYGYSYKIQVDVNGQIVLFEPDEERNFRAIINPNNFEKFKNVDVELLKVIGEALEKILYSITCYLVYLVEFFGYFSFKTFINLLNPSTVPL